MTILEDFNWTIGSWSIGKSQYGWSAYVHGHGICTTGNSKSDPKEAFESAVASFNEQFPDEITVKRKRLADARAEIEQLKAEGVV